MVDVKFDYIFLTKNFEHVKDFSKNRENNPIFNGHYILIPNNKNMFPYMKYVKYYGPSSGNNYHDALDDYSSKKYEDYLKLEKLIYKFREEIIIIFEFPDEETAFYFKMKFC